MPSSVHVALPSGKYLGSKISELLWGDVAQKYFTAQLYDVFRVSGRPRKSASRRLKKCCGHIFINTPNMSEQSMILIAARCSFGALGQGNYLSYGMRALEPEQRAILNSFAGEHQAAITTAIFFAQTPIHSHSGKSTGRRQVANV